MLEEEKNSEPLQLAVFVDFENLAVASEKEYGELDLTMLLDALKMRGYIAIRRAYGDWSRFERYRPVLNENAIDLIQLYSYSVQRGGKNRADIRIAIDVMEVVFTRRYINTIVILSGDSDFSSLMTKVREYGKKAIGAGVRGATSELLVNACDEFVFYESLIGEDETAEIGTQMQQARDALSRSLRTLVQADRPTVSAMRLKQALLAFAPDFSELSLGYRQFKDFLLDNRDLVDLKWEGRNLYVGLPSAATQPSDTRRRSVLDMTEQYKLYLADSGLRVIEFRTRREILADIFLTLQEQPYRLNLNQVIDRLKESYDAENVLRPRVVLRTAARLAYGTNFLDYQGEPPSFLAPVAVKRGVGLEKFSREAEAVYIRKLAEVNLPLQVRALSFVLFGRADEQDYVQQMLQQMKKNKQLKVINGEYVGISYEKIQELLAQPAFAAVRGDLQSVKLPILNGKLTLALAEKKFQRGMSLRTENFAESAKYFLQALKIQESLVQQRSPGASLDDFQWYMASYCSVRAGEWYNRRDYDRAKQYYLAFFALLRDGEPVWDKVVRLYPAVLSFYFTIAAARGKMTYSVAPGQTPPIKMAVWLNSHEVNRVREDWKELVRELAQVNPALVRLLIERLQNIPERDRHQSTLDVLRHILKENK